MIIGFAGKYRLFPCESELYMVCERRNPNYPYPTPPIIKKIPTRKLSGSNVNTASGVSFSGSGQSPSFGVGGAVASSIGVGDPGLTPLTPHGFLPRPSVPQNTLSVNTDIFNPARPTSGGGSITLPIKKNPFIQLHDKLENMRKRIVN